MLKLDKDKYRQIARIQGANAALTALHADSWTLEHETFEGQDGWQPRSWEHLTEIREFSRELWGMALEEKRA